MALNGRKMAVGMGFGSSTWMALPDMDPPRVALNRRPSATAIGAPPPDDDGPFSRLFGQYVVPELLGLWLVEVMLCGGLFYLLLTAGGTEPGAGLQAANRAMALAVTFGVTSAAVGLYSPDTYLRTRGLLITSGIGALLGLPVLWVAGRCLGLDVPGLDVRGLAGGQGMFELKLLLGGTLLLFATRMAFSYALRSSLFVRRVLIVGDAADAARIGTAISVLRSGFFEIAGVLPPGDLATLTAGALRRDRVWSVVVAARAGEALQAWQVLRAREQGVRLCSDAEFWERRLRRIDVGEHAEPFRLPAATTRTGRGGNAAAQTVASRAGDIVLSLTLLVFTLPLMLVTALAVLCESRGPVLYCQERVGLNGRVFTLRKFRSMRRDAEAGGPVWAAARDSRVTRVGALIRLLRIDELPQLVNVLRGEMSFIGPRPERPHFVAQLEELLPSYRERLRVKPGLTGWAQVNYPYGASVEDARAKLSYDLYYVKHRGLLLDLLILLATVRVVLFQRGAR